MVNRDLVNRTMPTSNILLLEPFPYDPDYAFTVEDANYHRGLVPRARNTIPSETRTIPNLYNGQSLRLHYGQRPAENDVVPYPYTMPPDLYSFHPPQQMWNITPPATNEAAPSLTGTGLSFSDTPLWSTSDSYGEHFVDSSNHYSGYSMSPLQSIPHVPGYRQDTPTYHRSPSQNAQHLSSSPPSVKIHTPPTHAASIPNTSTSWSSAENYSVTASPPVQAISVPSTSASPPSGKKYTHHQEYQLFINATSLPPPPNAGPFIPQNIYKPHTNSDRKRYVEEVSLEGPLYFIQHPVEYGIPLVDALHSRVKKLVDREKSVFEGRGPSVSIRLEWPGYRQWTRQIPTKDFRSPPGPITMAKLAKNIAKCVQRFIDENKDRPLDEPVQNRRWKVGHRANELKIEDLVLVSLHHVSLGSWQPHLRLRRPIEH